MDEPLRALFLGRRGLDTLDMILNSRNWYLQQNLAGATTLAKKC